MIGKHRLSGVAVCVKDDPRTGEVVVVYRHAPGTEVGRYKTDLDMRLSIKAHNEVAPPACQFLLIGWPNEQVYEVGALWDPDREGKDIAAELRKTIKDWMKDGSLPAMPFSVRSGHLGYRTHITIHFRLCPDDRLKAAKSLVGDWLRERNYDCSYINRDHWDVGFYADVKFDDFQFWGRR